MKVAIYALFDEEHNLRYVGKTIDLEDRIRTHKKTKRWLYSYEIIEWADESRWAEMEKFWISYLRSVGYDLIVKFLVEIGVDS